MSFWLLHSILRQLYMKKLVEPLYDYVSFNDGPEDSHLLIYTRGLAVTWACSLDIGDCVSHSVSLYKEWMDKPTNSSWVFIYAQYFTVSHGVRFVLPQFSEKYFFSRVGCAEPLNIFLNGSHALKCLLLATVSNCAIYTYTHMCCTKP